MAQRRAARSTAQHGFSLIEILIVILVLSIVASIALVALFNAVDRSKQRATMADMRTVARAIESYMVDYHLPPDDSGGLIALKPVLTPYQSNVLPVRDHWLHDLQYNSDTSGNYTLESYGKDGVAGADINVASRFEYDLDIVLTNGMFTASPE